MSASAKKIVLAGRTFVPVGESTVEHDIEFVRLLKLSGIGESRAAEGEVPDDVAFRMLEQLIEAKALLPLVACLIIPEEDSPRRAGALARLFERAGILRREAARGGWSHELQAKTVEFLKGLDEPQDKQRVYALVAELLFPFLSGVLGSWRPSPRSSGIQSGPPVTERESVPSAGATSGSGET